MSSKMFFSGRPRSRLLNAQWDEISGVDAPANGSPGWLVMKAEYNPYEGSDGSLPGEGAEELAEELWETDFTTCPPNIQSAAQVLITWLKQEGYDGQSEENSEYPDDALSDDLSETDFSSAPPNVKAAADALGGYLAEHNNEDDDSPEDDEAGEFPPVGIQMYPGSQTRGGQYSLRNGNGSNSFAGALSTDHYQGRSTPRRARGMQLTKGSASGVKMGKMGYKKLARMIRKAAGGDFYGPDFGSQPFTTGNNNSYFSPSSTSQFRGSDSAPSGSAGSFYGGDFGNQPYANAEDTMDALTAFAQSAALSQSSDKEALGQAFDQFLSASWPDFAKKAAAIVANYSKNIAPYTGGISGESGPNVTPETHLPSNIAKSQAREEIAKAVGELQDTVMRNLTAWACLEKRDFSSAQRKRLASTHAAMPDGSFPIANKQDLMNARHAIGQANNPAAVKAHIKRRAAALGAKLPPNWN